MQELALVCPVAGMSSRFGGKIKQFVRVGPRGETLIEYSLNQALPAGFTKIVFVVGEKTEKPFKEKFGTSFKGIPVFYSKQTFDPATRDKPWGTIDALCTTKGIVNCPYIFCNGDDLYGKNTFKVLADHLRNNEDNAMVGYTLLKVIPEMGKTNRAILKVDEDNFLIELAEAYDIEKQNLSAANLTGDELCSMNIFAFQPETLDMFMREINEFKKLNAGDRKKECIFANHLVLLVKTGEIKIKVYPAVDQWTGITNPEDEEQVRAQLELLEKQGKW
jgi:NDP-sugar pyrophosphorylase family protein